MSDEFEQQTIKQTRGPTLRFSGRLLAETDWETGGRMPMDARIEIWETPGGAMVAVSYQTPRDRAGFDDVRATVVEPMIRKVQLDELPTSEAREKAQMKIDQERIFAVMDHFNWDNRARAMVRKDLGWSLVQEVA